MILDRIENWRLYPFGPAWTAAFGFLSAVPPGIPDGVHPIRGDDIVARTMTYQTRSEAQGVLETHREFADVQAVIEGAERCRWFAQPDLPVKTAYDSARDAEFYTPVTPVPADALLVPGTFALFLPRDAHMPSLSTGPQSTRVRKIVIKIRTHLMVPCLL
jgi:biofilm protein TabA